ncbi:recombinase family protein [Sulfitobacter sp. JBTF-M27]|uniref:Recombinase family protein n=2 Tax=Sulfitobacter sediminilitoris TaxID=2698830 RepID=A0A6P0CGB9_9RHOB|nr:recombinase family protein [Sulfitobacter sediminilitoris]NEK25179.1 recombinase family protein [Sulfitobacter sediminilitoris]
MRRVRCAIYTRKSSEDGLEQDFNSLDAQREACEAYIASQKHEGWEVLPDRFDDGGISGGHLERPSLQRLMQAVDEKRVDQIVVYKIDRLTRSLADFAKLVDRLDAAEASFVSVTQSFNTATSMGRLTLNVLLSFAQFEREVTAERIRDKIAASKRKGLWMGGNVPLGYQADGRTLKIEEQEAATIRCLYELYLKHGAIREVKEHADALGLRSRQRLRGAGRISGGTSFDRGHIHHILSNPIYAGRIRHKGQVYEGQHPAVIEPMLWEQVQKMLAGGATRARGAKRVAARSPLAGKLFDETGDRLTPSHSNKNGKRLRYYISHRLVKDRSRKHPDAWRLPAEQVEGLISDLIAAHLKQEEIAIRLIRDLNASQVEAATANLHAIQQTKDCLTLVERADLCPGMLTIRLHLDELAKVVECDRERISSEELILTSPFQMRRRGVELKLHLGEAPAEIDPKLVQNVVNAQKWMSMILGGKTFAEIANAEGTSKRRIQDVVDLAMLSPDVLDAIAAGEQPDGLTSDYLIKSGVPARWSEQRETFAKL